jgi:hypothetical protein
MTQLRGRTLPVLLGALLLVGGANLAAYAATGDPLLAGKGNRANKPTAIKNTGNGPALVLKSRRGAPPLKVSSPARVARLNADRVDGLNGAALQTRAHTYYLPFGAPPAAATVQTLRFPGLPRGRYLATYTAAGNWTTTPTVFTCSLRLAGVPQAFGLSYGVIRASDNTATTSGSAFLDTASYGVPTLRCLSNQSFIWDQTIAGVFEVTFTRVDVGAELSAVPE